MKDQCYKCKYRGTVPGSAHSSCKKFDPFANEVITLLAASNFDRQILQGLGIEVDQHGLDNGWVLFPTNFDPVWIESCKHFEEEKDGN